MEIKELPESIELFRDFKREYERANCVYHPANRRVADATIAILEGWYPRLMRRGIRWAVYALLDEVLRRSFDYPKPPTLAVQALHGSLLVAARVLRLMPPRRRPFLLTRQKHRSHANGYKIEELGPPAESQSLFQPARYDISPLLVALVDTLVVQFQRRVGRDCHLAVVEIGQECRGISAKTGGNSGMSYRA